MNKTNGMCAIDNAVSKHRFDPSDLDAMPSLQDGREWEQFIGSSQKSVTYQNAEADHWGSLCKGTRAIGDIDCHYVQKGYSHNELERVYTYVSTHLCSDREQTVEFGLGADDSFELWISGVSLLKRLPVNGT